MQISAKAPGKVILIGEHAVVYGQPAIVLPINKYITCRIKPQSSTGIRFIQQSFNFDQTFSLKHILQSADHQQGLLRAPFCLIQGFAKYFKLKEISSIIIETTSQFGQGGYGSSTAYLVSMLKALIKYYQLSCNDQQLFELITQIESKFQNYQVSGIDQAVIVFNKPILFEKFAAKSITPIDIKSKILNNILVINTGKAINTTGEVVNWLKNQMLTNKQQIENIFNKIGKLSKQTVEILINEDSNRFAEIIDQSSQLLIKLGIVRPQTIRLIEQIHKLGGHAKLTGGGAISGDASGAILCYYPSKEVYQKITELLNQKKLSFFNL